MKPSAIASAYDRAAAGYATSLFWELHDKHLDRKLYDLFFERTANRGPVLEFGCGPGEISNYLWMKGLDIRGVDISPAMVDQARSLNPHIEFMCADALNFEWSGAPLAGIVAPFLIVNYRLEELPALFDNFHRLLPPGGWLMLSFHVEGSGLAGQVHASDFFVPGNEIEFTMFKLHEVQDVLASAGFARFESLVREPYPEEKTTRAYLTLRKPDANGDND